jgi:hypothetical protein
MTARKRGIATRKESPNGRANQQLAGGERWVVSHLSVRERNGETGKLWPRSPFMGKERERMRPWSRTSATGHRRLARLAGPQHGDESLVPGL